MIKRTSLLAALAAFLLALLPTGAHAETGYRYWSYWINDGSWALSDQGAGTVAAVDGSLQGWRFITAGPTPTVDKAPRSTRSFDSICADTPATDGMARIALVVDFGDGSDYGDTTTPPATVETCVEVISGDPSITALTQAFDVRANAGFVCGISNMPASGCGESVELPDSVVAPMPMAATTSEKASSRADFLPTLVTTVLGIIVFVMAWRLMLKQKAQARQRLENPTNNQEPKDNNQGE